MKIYFKTKKAKVFIIGIFLALLSIPFFTLDAFASSTHLEHIAVEYDTSGDVYIDAVPGNSFYFYNKIHGPAWEGTDKDDVIRVFTFFDKTQIEFKELRIYNHSRAGATSLKYPGAFTDNTNSPAYAEEALRFGSTTYDTKNAKAYGDSTDYGGRPMWYFHTLDIENATGGRNPCKDVYEDIIDNQSTTDFPNLKNNDPATGGISKANIGCIGFERFRGEDSGTVGSIYPRNNTEVFISRLGVTADANNGESNLISVVTSDGYKLTSDNTKEPDITENTVTLNIINDTLKTETFEVLNPPADGIIKGIFTVKVGFVTGVTGFVEDADFQLIEIDNTTGTEVISQVGTILYVREAHSNFTTTPNTYLDYSTGDGGYAAINGKYFLVRVFPDVGVNTTAEKTYRFEIKTNTGITTESQGNGFVESTVGTYQLSLDLQTTLQFEDLEIPYATLSANFVQKDYNSTALSAKREYFSRSEDIGVEFYATSNNTGGQPLLADFSLKESASFDPSDPPTDCINNTPTFSNITSNPLDQNSYFMTITLPTGKYNCLLAYSQTIDGQPKEKTLPIVYKGRQYFVNSRGGLDIGSRVFDTFYINAETPPPVSFGPSPVTEVQTNSRTHTITSESPSNGFNYFNIGLNLDVYNQLIDSSTDCDENLNWASNTKSDNTFTTNNENENGRFICVRNYDDFVTINVAADSFYSYETFEVQSIDTTKPTIISAELENFGTQSNDFKVKVSFSEDMGDVNIADFSFVENDSTSGTLVESTVGAITNVEAYDSIFATSTGDSTSDTTTIEGQYFLVSVTADDDIETTTDKIYEFQIDTDISDVALNSIGSSASNKTLEVTINTQGKPTVSAALTNSGVLGKEFVVDVTFSEEVLNVDTGDFDFIETTNGAVVGNINSVVAFENSDFIQTDQTPNTSRYYQVTVTAVDDLVSIINGYAFRVLNDSTSAIADKVGNLLDDGGVSGDVRFNFVISNIDTTKPTATIAAITDTKNAAFTVQVSFSETVNNVGLVDFEFTDGTDQKGSISSVFPYDSTFTTPGSGTANFATNISGQYFVVTVTPDSSLEGSYTFKVLADAANTITDALSNSFVEEDINSQIQISVDTIDPTTTIEPITDTQNGAFNVKVSFSESVKNVDTGDFRFVKKNTNSIFSTITKVEAFDETFTTSTGSSTTDTTSISGQYFVVSLTPSNDIQTDSTTIYSFEVFSNSTNTITDTTGNALSLIASADIDIDTKKPTVTVVVDGSGTQGKNFAVNVTFSEVVNNVTVDDFTFIQTGTTTSAGTITEVQLHSDSNFNDTSPNTTTQTGQYFKVLVEGVNDIETSSTTTYTFNVIANTDQANLIADSSANTFQVDANSSILVDINTKSAPTVLSLSTLNGIQTGVFEINVTFSEEVSNVDIGDFRFVLKDQDTASATTFGTIVVELHSDSNFNDTNPSTTTDTTTLSGTYFKIKVTPQDNLTTDTGVVDYEFQVINDTTNSIIDGIGNVLGAQTFSGVIRGVTDVNIDTAHPKTESISLDTAGTQTTTFDVRVSFTEAVNNVGISNFEFTDGTNSFGVIKSVVVYNSTFETAGDSTDVSSSVAGRYFKVSIKPNEDINDTYTFKVLSGSISDDRSNSFETSSNDTLSVTVNTERAPTLTSLSILDDLVTPKTGDFEIDIIFSESISGVDIDDFRFVRTGTANLKGSITKVEAFDETFTTSTGSSTTDTTTIQGQYFRVSVHPKDALRTNENGTPSVTYTFEILSSGSITDGAGNAFDSTSGIATTLDVAVDTLDPLIINTEIINNKLVLTSSISLNNVTVTGAGGFTVTGNDGTAYTVSNVAIAGITITISFTSGTTPTNRGTYTYTKVSSLTIQTSSSNTLSNIASTTYGPDFTLDLDSSGDYTASKDGLFLYLYTQTAYTLNDTALSQLIDSNSSLVDTKAKISDGLSDDSLDLDSSGDYTASKDGLFLYLYTQTAYSLNDTALSQLIDSSSSLQGTKDNIAKFLP